MNRRVLFRPISFRVFSQSQFGEWHAGMTKQLAIFVSHPVQYFAPLWRALARTEGPELTVHFFSDHSVRGGVDAGFGVSVRWDVPLLAGYQHRFISRSADLSRPSSVGVAGVRRLLERG